MKKRTVLIIGGGPAGLTAALRLTERGHAVTLLEQRDRLGGRLFADQSPDHDAMPPVLLGFQSATLGLLATLETSRSIEFPQDLSFEFVLPGGYSARLAKPWLPAPLHTVLGLLTFSGLPLRDRWKLLDVIERSWEGDPALSPDLDQQTADEWLASRGQSERARADVWAPLARFLTGEDPTTLSAAVLISMLTRCFLTARRHSRLAIPASGFRSLLIDPLSDRLTRAGATIRLRSGVTQIQIDGNRVSGLRLQDGSTMTADCYVVTLPHRQLAALVPERVLTHFAYFQQLTRLTDAPTLSIHLRMTGFLPAPRLLLLARRIFHWLTTTHDADKGTQVSLVATGRMELLGRSDDELREMALTELAYVYPESAAMKVQTSRIVREPAAFLSLGPGTTVFRPLPQSPFLNLYIGGDWTDTGLPATLESAILSGNRCAEAITAGIGV